MPWIQYPRSPGHEVAGVIDEVGPNVTLWEKGQKVGVGWHGGHDFTCVNCRRGDFINCVNEKWAGIHYDGGYAEYMVAPWEAVAAVPDSLDPAEAAPLLCAGITTFNALRRAGAIPGDLVAVLRTATRSPGIAPARRSALNVVMPAHSSGAASAGSSESGTAATASHGATIYSA